MTALVVVGAIWRNLLANSVPPRASLLLTDHSRSVVLPLYSAAAKAVKPLSREAFSAFLIILPFSLTPGRRFVKRFEGAASAGGV